MKPSSFQVQMCLASLMVQVWCLADVHTVLQMSSAGVAHSLYRYCLNNFNILNVFKILCTCDQVWRVKSESSDSLDSIHFVTPTKPGSSMSLESASPSPNACKALCPDDDDLLKSMESAPLEDWKPAVKKGEKKSTSKKAVI